MKSQTNRIIQIMIEASKYSVCLFRNNVAKAWVGTGRPETTKKPKQVWLFEGDVLLRKARILHAGLYKGSHDLIGYRSVTITPDMVGKKVAIFTGVEDKSKTDRVKPDQKKFHDAIDLAGGYSLVARSVDDVSNYFDKL